MLWKSCSIIEILDWIYSKLHIMIHVHPDAIFSKQMLTCCWEDPISLLILTCRVGCSGWVSIINSSLGNIKHDLLNTHLGHDISDEVSAQEKLWNSPGVGVTPPNFKVCAQRKVPVKRFKICHILYTYTKTQRCFFRFSFRATLCFYLMNALRGFSYYMKHFYRALSWAQTSYFWRVL